MCHLIIRLIMNTYMMSISLVKWNQSMSKPFNICNGVKQGAVLSAPLFALYIDPLLYRLRNTKQGCYIGNLCANAFAYADDIVLLSPTCMALKCLINICEEFANEYMLNFNPDKCKLLIFSSSDLNFDHVNITICNNKIENVKSEKHLGNLFQNSNTLINIDSIIKDIYVRTNVIVNKFRPISWQAKVKLFLSQCSSLYGCQIWQLEDPKLTKLYTGWRVCCRKIIGVHPQTRSYLLPNVMNSMPIDDVVMLRMILFFLNGLNHKSELISCFFKNTLLSNSSYMLVNVNTILNKYDIKYIDLLTMNKTCIRNVINNHNEGPDWRCNSIKELLFLREDHLFSELNMTEINEILNHISIFR